MNKASGGDGIPVELFQILKAHPLPTHLTRCWPITPTGIKWLPALRAPGREVSPPAGAGRSLVTQHAGTAYAENTAQ